MHIIASPLSNPHPDILKIFNHVKVLYTNDPLYENPSIFENYKIISRDKFSESINKKILLFFGNPFYGKGLDIPIRAMDYLSKDYNLFIGSDLQNSNFKIQEFKNKPNLIIYDRFISESEMPLLFNASNIVFRPHRKSYEHVTSGVFI